MALKEGYGNISGIIAKDIRDTFTLINKLRGVPNNQVLENFAANYNSQYMYLLKDLGNPIETSKESKVDSAEIDSAAGNVTFDYGNGKLLGYVYFSPATQQPQQQ